MLYNIVTVGVGSVIIFSSIADTIITIIQS